MKYIIQSTNKDNGESLSLKGAILNKSGVDYDLNNLDSDLEKEIYINENENVVIKLTTGKYTSFMLINGNFKRFYDKDANGLIDLQELEVFIDDYNRLRTYELAVAGESIDWNSIGVEENDLKALKTWAESNRKKIYDDYMAIDGNNKITWMAKGQ